MTDDLRRALHDHAWECRNPGHIPSYDDCPECEHIAALAARSEPRAEGHAHDFATVDVIGHPGIFERRCVICAKTPQDAATPPAEGLDVERLARALPDYLLDTENGILHREPVAQQIAAAYAALAPEQPE